MSKLEKGYGSDSIQAILGDVKNYFTEKFAMKTSVPTKVSDLTNDSGFITKVVDDLVNYYLKSETYSKSEVDALVTAIKNSRFEPVDTLPTEDIKTNVIYLVPSSDPQVSNIKDEYINLDGTTAGWEKIGSTDIDLSGYVTTAQLNTALADYVTSTNLTTILADYATTASVTSAISTKADLVDGKVADEQIPDSAHDVIPYDDVSDFPEIGEIGKIYIAFHSLGSYVYSEDKDEYAFTDGNMGSVTIDNTGGEELPVSAELTVTQYMGGESLTYNGYMGFYNSYPDDPSVPPYLAVGSRQILDKAGKEHLNVGDKIVLYKYDGTTRCVYRSYENGSYTDYDVSDCIFNSFQYTPDHDQYLMANSSNIFTVWTSGPWTVSSTLSVLKGGSYQAVGSGTQADWSQTNATAPDYINVATKVA